MFVRRCHALLISLLVIPAFSQAMDHWIEVGSAKARFSESTLTVFPKTKEPFSMLRFHVSHGEVILHQARVYLDTGEIFHVNLQKSIKNPHSVDDGRGYSRMIPLTASQQRPIKKVTVFYKFKQQTSSRQVTIELLGIPANHGTGSG